MDIDNNKLLIIARGGGITEPKTYQGKEKTKTMGASLDSRGDSKGAYFLIINDLRFTDKEDFRKSV